MTPRILVTVSRSWKDWPLTKAALADAYTKYPGAVLVHGDTPKGDRDAARIWRGMGGQVEAWPAKWIEHGDDCYCTDRSKRCRFAGFRRNLAMVDSGPDLVLAFIHNNSRGATHCARAAEDAGIPTVRYLSVGGAR